MHDLKTEEDARWTKQAIEISAQDYIRKKTRRRSHGLRWTDSLTYFLKT